MTIPLINYSLASAGHKRYAHDNSITSRRTEIVTYRFRRQLFGMDVREIRTSSQDDAKDGCGISNFGKKFYKLSFVGAPEFRRRDCRQHLKTKVIEVSYRGPPRGSCLRHSLSSLGTHSTWLRDVSDHISRGEKLMDNE